MKAKRTKHFPIFKLTEADECPACGCTIVSIGGNRTICAACASKMIEELRLALKVAQICNNTGSGFTQFSEFDNLITDLLRGKFPKEEK